MSSLWTPSGEHPVDRPGDRAGSGPGRSAPSAPAGPPPGAPGAGERELTADERAAAEEYARQLDTARQQLLDAPPALVVAQQALQFHDLAAMYLSQPDPRLDAARLAVDALAAVVDGLGARLGEAETPLRQALHQVRLAVVQTSGQAPPPASPPEPPAESPPGG